MFMKNNIESPVYVLKGLRAKQIEAQVLCSGSNSVTRILINPPKCNTLEL